MTRRSLLNGFMTCFLWATAALIGALLLALLAYLFRQGAGVLSWEFLTEYPRDSMTRGGILTPMVGTLQLVAVSMAFALPVGVCTGLYFAEYADDGPFASLLRLAVRCLAGVPSVVFGLFGLSLFVILLRFGPCLLSAGLTLGCLSLPLIVTASEQAFLAVPQEYRQASYALGATKGQTIARVVVPTAMPTILTGAILAVGRVAGETAPVIFTGAAFFAPQIAKSLFEQVMCLPYHVMVLATAGTNIEATRPVQYGTVLVLMGLVMGVSSLGIWLRARLRNKRL